MYFIPCVFLDTCYANVIDGLSATAFASKDISISGIKMNLYGSLCFLYFISFERQKNGNKEIEW